MGRHDDDDDSIAAWFVNRDREFKGWPVGNTAHNDQRDHAANLGRGREPRGGELPIEDFGDGAADATMPVFQTAPPSSHVKRPAPQTDEELAWGAFNDATDDNGLRTRYDDFVRAVSKACATARAEGRAEGRADALAGRGEATAPDGQMTSPSGPKPASEALEAVASALWKQWWRSHGEAETEIQFPQLYDNARQRWVDIAVAGLAAWNSMGPREPSL